MFASGLTNNCAKAMNCRDIVNILHGSPICYTGGVGLDLFDKEDVQSDDVWKIFREKMSRHFRKKMSRYSEDIYSLDTFVCDDYQNLDSRNFLYLLLYTYDRFAQWSKSSAEKVVKRLVCESRNPEEQYLDKIVFKELSAFRPEFEVLKPLFKVS